jgi:flagellar assembly factor FliW
MGTKTIQTSRFGEIEIDETKLIQFISPILGFDAHTQYVVLDHDPDSPFKWLQAVDDPALAFVITDPKLFQLAYDFPISPETLTALGVQLKSHLMILTIVNIPEENPEQMTANLLGPILLNTTTMTALQVVLSETEYSTRARLISDEMIAEQMSSGKPG